MGGCRGTRAAGEGRVSLPEVDSCSAMAAQSLSAALRGRQCSSSVAGSTMGSSRCWNHQTPRRHWRQPLTDATTRSWIVDWSSGSESAKIEKKTEYACGRIAGLFMLSTVRRQTSSVPDAFNTLFSETGAVKHVPRVVFVTT